MHQSFEMDLYVNKWDNVSKIYEDVWSADIVVRPNPKAF